MEFLGKKAARVPTVSTTTQQKGQAAEALALAHLQTAGLRLLARNYRTPGRGGGEIDLIVRDRDGTVVFVEVRSRSRSDFGGAGASINSAKQRRIIFAARHYLMRLDTPPPCRFDAVLINGDKLEWVQGAFEAQ